MVELKNIFRSFSLLWAVLFLTFLVGARAEWVGTDTHAYYNIYDVVVDDDIPYEEKRWEPLYQALNNFLAFFNLGADYVLLLSAFISLSLYLFFLYKFSPKPFLALMLYLGFFGFFLNFNIVRQMLAVSFFVWAVYFFYLRCLPLFLLASSISIFFHYTAFFSIIIFLIFFCFFSFRLVFFLWVFSLFVVFSSELVSLFRDVLVFFGGFLGGSYKYYFEGMFIQSPVKGFRIFAFQFFFFVACFFYKKTEGFQLVVLKVIMLSVVAYNLLICFQYFDRIVVYYMVLFPVFISYSVCSSFKKDFIFLVDFLILSLSIFFVFRNYINGSNGIYPYASWIF